MLVGTESPQVEHLFFPECKAWGAGHTLCIFGSGWQLKLLSGEGRKAFWAAPVAHARQARQTTEAHPGHSDVNHMVDSLCVSQYPGWWGLTHGPVVILLSRRPV